MACGCRGAVKTSRGKEKPHQTLLLIMHSLLCSVLFRNKNFFNSIQCALKEEPISFQRANLWRTLYQLALSAAPPFQEG